MCWRHDWKPENIGEGLQNSKENTFSGDSGRMYFMIKDDKTKKEEKKGSIKQGCQPKGKKEKNAKMMVTGDPVLYWVPSDQEPGNALVGIIPGHRSEGMDK